MKVSLNWVRSINDKYACSADPAPDGIDKLVEKIGAQLGAVEEIVDLGRHYEGIVVAKVVACEKHPNADKLSVCLVDDAKVVKNMKRDEKGLVQVVCGAPNVKAGQLVAWIPPGVAVPSTYDKDPLVLEAREIRGVTSNGMIASLKELALGDNHEGILAIEENVKAGTPFAKVYDLDDHIIDIENKMFTHRPDLFGQLGIARELAGIQHHVFVSPPIYKEPKTTGKITRDHLSLEVKNEVPQLVPRFVAQVFRNVQVGPSPMWLQSYLLRVGIRPINNVVDITNYYMMLTAQPLHAYDYDKVASGGKKASLSVRLSKKGEKLSLLGGKTITLDSGAVVITDGQKPIGLGGIMGGSDTEVDERTKHIILECANFDMNLTRHSARLYGLFTDAAIRFTKNQSPLQNDRVVAWASEELIHLTGAMPDGTIHDTGHRLPSPASVKITSKFINERLGLSLNEQEISKLLKNVEFEVEKNGAHLVIKVPFWRTDVEIAEDIVEEVGRLYGYDHLPLDLPKRDLTPARPNDMLDFKSRVRHILATAGGNEVLTYSFVHDSLLDKAEQNKAKAFHIRNALSPDLKCYRLSLTPSLLEKVHPNIKLGFERFGLFELGRAHVKGVEDKEKLPLELERLALVVASSPKDKAASAPFYQAKYLTNTLFKRLSIEDVEYSPLGEAKDLPLEWKEAASPFEAERVALLKKDRKILGLVGEPTARLKESLKLPAQIAQFELDLAALQLLSKPTTNYRPLNRYPAVEQDICLKSKASISFAELDNLIHDFLREAENEGYNGQVHCLDIFQKDPGFKQTTWRVSLSHPTRTLTNQQANQLLDQLAEKANKKFGAGRV